MLANLQIKQELPVGDIFVNISGRNQQSLQRTYHICFLPSFSSLASGFRGEDFQKQINQKQELPVAAMFVNESGRNEQSLQRTLQKLDASYQDSVHLAQGFQRRRLKCEQFTDDDDGSSDGNSSRCFWQGELKRNRNIDV